MKHSKAALVKFNWEKPDSLSNGSACWLLLKKPSDKVVCVYFPSLTLPAPPSSPHPRSMAYSLNYSAHYQAQSPAWERLLITLRIAPPAPPGAHGRPKRTPSLLINQTPRETRIIPESRTRYWRVELCMGAMSPPPTVESLSLKLSRAPR